MKNMLQGFVFRKFVLTGMLAIALFAFLAPEQAHAAPKKKLTKDQVEAIYKKINSMPQTYEVWSALKVIVKGMDNVKADKSISKAAKDMINDILDIDETRSMFSNMVTLMDLADRYRKGKKEDAINNGANLMFDTLEFAGGLALPGGYIRTIVTAGKAALAAMNNHAGVISYYSYVDDDSMQNTNISSLCYLPEYEDFARAWYAKAYYTVGKNSQSTQRARDKSSLFEIGTYIKALMTLRSAGLIN